jgi:hypothetical protein
MQRRVVGVFCAFFRARRFSDGPNLFAIHWGYPLRLTYGVWCSQLLGMVCSYCRVSMCLLVRGVAMAL